MNDVLDQVRAGTIALGQAGAGTVETNGHRRPPGDNPFPAARADPAVGGGAPVGFAHAARRTLERLGGAERLVRSHLADALAELDDHSRDITAAVFHQLVTPSGTKIVHTVPDLAEYAEAPESELVPVLESLAAARILRPVDPAPGETTPRFEIFHDVLAPAILDWRAAHEQARVAREAAARRRTVRRRLAAGGSTMLLLVVVFAGLAIWALGQRSEAQKQAEVARSQALAASAVSQLDADPELGLAARSRGCGRETDPGGRGCLAPRADVVAPACRRADPRPCPQRRDLTRRQPRAHRRRSGDCARAERNRRRRRPRFLRRRPRQRRGFRSDRPADRHGEHGRHRADPRRESRRGAAGDPSRFGARRGARASRATGAACSPFRGTASPAPSTHERASAGRTHVFARRCAATCFSPRGEAVLLVGREATHACGAGRRTSRRGASLLSCRARSPTMAASRSRAGIALILGVRPDDVTGELLIVDSRTGVRKTIFVPGGAVSVAFSPGGRFVATAGPETARIWDTLPDASADPSLSSEVTRAESRMSGSPPTAKRC